MAFLDRHVPVVPRWRTNARINARSVSKREIRGWRPRRRIQPRHTATCRVVSRGRHPWIDAWHGVRSLAASEEIRVVGVLHDTDRKTTLHESNDRRVPATDQCAQTSRTVQPASSLAKWQFN